MSVNQINGIANASYPKYLENRRKTAGLMLLSGATLATGTAAMHLSKMPIATKHPALLAAGAALGVFSMILGLNGTVNAAKELNKYG